MIETAAARRLVAHRGASADCPENTLVAIETALRAGAVAVEFDVQFSADGVPFVIHDPVLMRTTGRHGRVGAMRAAELDRISAHEPARFGERFAPQPVPRLSRVIGLLDAYPQCTAFVELKRHAIRQLGTRAAVSALVDALRDLANPAVLISFDADAIECAGELGVVERGWVLREWDAGHRARAQAMAPSHLIVNVQKVGESALWPGPWQWMVYEVGDPDTVSAWLGRGADWVETNSIVRLLDPRAVPPVS